MRFIKGILFTLLAVGLIVCTAVFVLFQTVDVEQYLGKLTNKASLILNRPVSIGRLGLGISLRGISLDAGPVTIADDQDFTQEPFVQIERVRIIPDFKRLVLEHKFHIAAIVLQFPQVHFIRSEEGRMNVQSLWTKNSSFVHTPAAVVQKSQVPDLPVKTVTPVPKEAGPGDSINKIIILDGAISFIDQSRDGPMDLWLNGIKGSYKAKSSHIFVMASIDGSEMPDNPIFTNISGVVQLAMDHLGLDPSGNINGQGSIIITNGVIKNFNIIQAVLAHSLGAFGNINGLLSPSLNSKLNAKDTLVKELNAQVSVHDKSFFLDDSKLQTDLLELTVKGSIGHDLNANFQTMLHLNTDLSGDLINEFSGVKIFADDSQRLGFGGELTGTIPHLKYKSNKDFKKKSRKMLFQAGANFLKGLL